jgi:threonine/homoserine/homoserine lactone efflux protein
MLFSLSPAREIQYAEYKLPDTPAQGGIAECLSTFLVVFLNPATYIMFSALFALFAIAKSYFGWLDSLEIALSVFGGATAFWVVVTQVVLRARVRIHDSFLSPVTRFASYAIVLFGLVILVHCLHDYLHLAS